MEDVSFCSEGDIQLSLLLHTQQLELNSWKNDWVKIESENTVSCGFYGFRICILDFWVNVWKAKKLVHKRMLSSLRFLAFHVVNILINNIRIHGWELLINSVLQWNKDPEFKRWLLLLHSEAAVPVLLLVLELSVPCRTKLTASVCVVCSYM